MAAETVTEIYRTQEKRALYQFKAVVTINYFNGVATLQGLCGSFSMQCWDEIAEHLKSRGIHTVRYLRRGKLKQIILKGPI